MVSKLKALIAIICLVLFGGAWPSSGLYPLIRMNGSITSAGYTGPGDIVSTGVLTWSGVRAWNNTLANSGASTTPALDVRGVNTATGCTVYLKGDGTGDLDLTTAGAGGVGHQCLLGVTTFCTVTNAGGCTVSMMYDQTGALKCVSSAACNPFNVTAASQPTFVFNCIGAKPCLGNTGSQFLFPTTTLTSAASQPISMSSVSKNDGASATNAAILADNTNGDALFVYSGSGTNAGIYAGGTTLNATYSTGVLAAQNDVANGASSVINLNGTETASGNNPGTGGFGTGTDFPLVFTSSFSNSGNNTYIAEVGGWATGFSAGNRTSFCQNQQAYYGSSNFGATC